MTTRNSKVFTDEEKSAMKARAKELKAGKTDGESDVLEKLAGMTEHDRAIGERIHAIVKASAPGLTPKLWYGMPSYANKDGKIVCFFQCAQKFGTRYATLGFNDKANLDEGHIWPVTYAVTELTAADEARLGDLVKKAVAED